MFSLPQNREITFEPVRTENGWRVRFEDGRADMQLPRMSFEDVCQHISRLPSKEEPLSCNNCGEEGNLSTFAEIHGQRLCPHCTGNFEMFDLGMLSNAIEKVADDPGANLLSVEQLGLTALCRYFDDAGYDDGTGEYPEPQRWRWIDATADTGIPEARLKDFIAFIARVGGWEYYCVSEQDAEGFHLFHIATQTRLPKNLAGFCSLSEDTPVDEIPF